MRCSSPFYIACKPPYTSYRNHNSYIPEAVRGRKQNIAKPCACKCRQQIFFGTAAAKDAPKGDRFPSIAPFGTRTPLTKYTMFVITVLANSAEPSKFLRTRAFLPPFLTSFSFYIIIDSIVCNLYLYYKILHSIVLSVCGRQFIYSFVEIILLAKLINLYSVNITLMLIFISI